MKDWVDTNICPIFTKNLKIKTMNKLYCDICDQASVEMLETLTEETFYCCTMCRDNNKDREIKDNNFNEDYVIDYKN